MAKADQQSDEFHSLHVRDAKRQIMTTRVHLTRKAVLDEFGLTVDRIYKYTTAKSYAGDIHVVDPEDGMVRELDEDELIAVARRLSGDTP